MATHIKAIAALAAALAAGCSSDPAPGRTKRAPAEKPLRTARETSSKTTASDPTDWGYQASASRDEPKAREVLQADPEREKPAPVA